MLKLFEKVAVFGLFSQKTKQTFVRLQEQLPRYKTAFLLNLCKKKQMIYSLKTFLWELKNLGRIPRFLDKKCR